MWCGAVPKAALKEGLDKSIQDLPAHVESGACPDSTSRNQSLTRLFRGPAILRPAEPPNQSEVRQDDVVLIGVAPERQKL
jgi:hypothetical protein